MYASVLHETRKEKLHCTLKSKDSLNPYHTSPMPITRATVKINKTNRKNNWQGQRLGKIPDYSVVTSWRSLHTD
jgi:hypothetical protein